MIDRLNERRRAASEGGFTLIELLVVIIILGILAAVVVFAVGGINNRGQESACDIDERTLRTAAEARYAQNTNYSDAPPADYVGAGPAITAAPGTNVEADYVGDGFLSEVSTYNELEVYDSNLATGVTPAIRVNPTAGGPCV